MNFSVVRKADTAWGSAFAKELAQRKRHLILLGSNIAGLIAMAEEIRERHCVSVLYFMADENDTTDIIKVCEKINNDFEVDLLVNYAETGLELDLDAYDIQSLDQRLKSQYATGTLYLHQLLPNLLLHGSPRVIDIWCSADDAAEWEKALVTYHMRFAEYVNNGLRETGLRMLGVPVRKPLLAGNTARVEAMLSRKAAEILDLLFRENLCAHI
jgi:NADP-dependent 3-hydroxy acid dehydrogenase YdfG